MARSSGAEVSRVELTPQDELTPRGCAGRNTPRSVLRRRWLTGQSHMVPSRGAAAGPGRRHLSLSVVALLLELGCGLLAVAAADTGEPRGVCLGSDADGYGPPTPDRQHMRYYKTCVAPLFPSSASFPPSHHIEPTTALPSSLPLSHQPPQLALGVQEGGQGSRSGLCSARSGDVFAAWVGLWHR
jgi:hypothetical protein